MCNKGRETRLTDIKPKSMTDEEKHAKARKIREEYESRIFIDLFMRRGVINTGFDGMARYWAEEMEAKIAELYGDGPPLNKF